MIFIQPNSKVLIRFYHGLGDLIMFIPCFNVLQNKYFNSKIDLEIKPEFAHYFKYYCQSTDQYDMVYNIRFACVEGSGKTKIEECCINELNIDYSKVLEYKLEHPQLNNPYVICHFHGISAQDKKCCTEQQIKDILQGIYDVGFIPIEISPDITKTVKLLAQQIKNSYAFIGIDSGPFHMAASLIPNRTLHLSRMFYVKDYTKLCIAEIDIKKEINLKNKISTWLMSLNNQVDIIKN